MWVWETQCRPSLIVTSLPYVRIHRKLCELYATQTVTQTYPSETQCCERFALIGVVQLCWYRGGVWCIWVGRGGLYRSGGGGRLWNDYEYDYSAVGLPRNARSRVWTWTSCTYHSPWHLIVADSIICIVADPLLWAWSVCGWLVT